MTKRQRTAVELLIAFPAVLGLLMWGAAADKNAGGMALTGYLVLLWIGNLPRLWQPE